MPRGGLCRLLADAGQQLGDDVEEPLAAVSTRPRTALSPPKPPACASGSSTTTSPPPPAPPCTPRATAATRMVVDEDRGVVVGFTLPGPDVAESLHAATIATRVAVVARTGGPERGGPSPAEVPEAGLR
ncbi:hypothetical protein [Lentzea guizhouensis]|uniref:hypothetical protein n=1 Tax=Lentzea guizhouensis TaxID=1586287 RepID=UPI003AAE9C58